MEQTIEVEGQRWRVHALPEQARRESEGWHLVRVRFDPTGETSHEAPRETWLRLEEDIPAGDVIDQYDRAQLVEAFLVAEEVESATDR